MNETTSSANGETDDGPICGERLAAARRQRQISLPDIARELHLDEAKVRALEENRFDALGAPVFAKGHMRKYAELVGVPLADLLADYYTLNRATGAPPVVGPPRRLQRDINIAPWLLGIPLALILAGAVYWWLGRAPSPAAPLAPAAEPGGPAMQRLPLVVERAPATPAPEPADSAPAATGAAAAGNPVAAAGGAAVPLAETAPATENAAPPRTAPAGGDVSLRLTYSGECWTEVTDGSGERLFFDLGRSGRTVRVSGAPPLRVLLGDSNNVSLSVNGEPYVIAAADLRGDTARLTINP